MKILFTSLVLSIFFESLTYTFDAFLSLVKSGWNQKWTKTSPFLSIFFKKEWILVDGIFSSFVFTVKFREPWVGKLFQNEKDVRLESQRKMRFQLLCIFFENQKDTVFRIIKKELIWSTVFPHVLSLQWNSVTLELESHFKTKKDVPLES